MNQTFGTRCQSYYMRFSRSGLCLVWAVFDMGRNCHRSYFVPVVMDTCRIWYGSYLEWIVFSMGRN